METRIQSLRNFSKLPVFCHQQPDEWSWFCWRQKSKCDKCAHWWQALSKCHDVIWSGCELKALWVVTPMPKGEEQRWIQVLASLLLQVEEDYCNKIIQNAPFSSLITPPARTDIPLWLWGTPPVASMWVYARVWIVLLSGSFLLKWDMMCLVYHMNLHVFSLPSPTLIL